MSSQAVLEQDEVSILAADALPESTSPVLLGGGQSTHNNKHTFLMSQIKHNYPSDTRGPQKRARKIKNASISKGSSLQSPDAKKM